MIELFYRCELCKKIISPQDSNEIVLPITSYGVGDTYSTMVVCKKCEDKYKKAVHDALGYIHVNENGEVSVE